MTGRAIDFAIAHLLGTTLGVIGGTVLPWWSSGGVGWGLYALAHIVMLALRLIREPMRVGQIWKVAPPGLLYGALAGALAADAAELASVFGLPSTTALADTAVAAATSTSVTLGLVVLVLGVDRVRSPHALGLVLYLITAAWSFAPAIGSLVR